MYLRFEDWSVFLFKLKESGLPHGDHIIKIYASQNDPRLKSMYGRDTVHIFEIDDSPFSDTELFEYGERGVYSGAEFESKIQDLNIGDKGSRKLRALLRFSNLPEMGSTQAAMQLLNSEGSWLINHPFGVIDSVSQVQRNPEKSDYLHLDIFLPEQLSNLAKLFQVERLEDFEGLITFSEIRELQRKILVEGKSRGKERY